MLRPILVAVCQLLLRVFFRRIEVVGRHHVPKDGSLLFALNHHSGLIDPLFILCLAERKVSFLAKAPLFDMPVVGTFVRAFESLPVYRSQDAADPKKNRAMMQAAAGLLQRGNALALFPEGTSHSDPALKRFRSGAARIALSARALGEAPVYVVPAALYYERKQTFRSRAVLSFGPAIEVPRVELDEAGESPIEIGQELTRRLERSVEAIMPTADNAQGLVLAERAERVFSAALRDSPEQCQAAQALLSEAETRGTRLTLAERMVRRRRLLDAYQSLVEKEPDAVASLIDRIQALGDELEAAGLPTDATANTPIDIARLRPILLLRALLLAPFALLGSVLHAPAYQLVRFTAFRYSANQDDITATVKLLAGLLLLPLTWLILGATCALLWDDAWGWSAAAAGPVFAWSALVVGELTGSLRRTSRTRQSAARVGLDWSEIVRRRADIADDMAHLLQRSQQSRGG